MYRAASTSTCTPQISFNQPKRLLQLGTLHQSRFPQYQATKIEMTDNEHTRGATTWDHVDISEDIKDMDQTETRSSKSKSTAQSKLAVPYKNSSETMPSILKKRPREEMDIVKTKEVRGGDEKGGVECRSKVAFGSTRYYILPEDHKCPKN